MTRPLRSPKLRDSFWRTLMTFDVTRVVIAILLFVLLAFNIKRGVSEAEHGIYWQTCISYLVLSILLAGFAFYYRGRFILQLLVQIPVDIVAISLLYAASGGARGGLAILFLFPLAGGAVLLPLVWALFFVSAVTIFLLAESGYQLFAAVSDASLSQSGLYGASFFASVYVINRLASRVINQEELALQRGQELQVQEAINRLVIADMGDGILVVEHDSTVQISNPAAERMLGVALQAADARFRLVDRPALAPIAEAFFDWLAKSERERAAADSVFVVVRPGEDAMFGATTIWGWRRELSVRLKLRFGTVKAIGQEGDRTVIFLQDVTEIENQAQQLKLASMGRLTASIAHEVRNPLSAISYAQSLLAEDAVSPASTRLLNIIGDNVARLNRMIEDILNLSRKAQVHGEPIALLPFVRDIVEELRETHNVQEGAVEMAGMGEHSVRFDPLHLREVLMNLLSNAIRYASRRPGSVRLHLVDNGSHMELHVQDDGAAISPEVRAHLFEPFYTTSSKGTGLGLYLARELCLNNGAMLDYEYRMEKAAHGKEEACGRFVVTFAADGEPSR
ncbi:MAG: two-component sensor histidine kinase [Burkholderiaceae bacterium]|nr:two-component sensor histidine kinase [Burkholderiaceae bacterium]